MKLFGCQNCGQLLFFENTRCERCESVLGYLSDRSVVSALSSEGGGRWRALAAPGEVFRFCANAAHGVCNWLVAADGPNWFCSACRLNRTIPNLDEGSNLLRWGRLEEAKHRLVYGLLRLGLPVVSKLDDWERGLAFDFLEGPAAGEDGPPVITGHSGGVVTLDVAEADDVERERQRSELVERYRTLLGHMRHEVGHYYWDRLVRDGVWHAAFRELFGDERRSYEEALESHYGTGPRPEWQEEHVSSYASAHPWEDFAETWAHYLHIVDTLETAEAFGLGLRPAVGGSAALAMEIGFDSYREDDFDALMGAWLPLTYALNSLSRSMGQPDLYPFVLSPPVVGKLRFVHGLVSGARAGG